MTVRDGADLGQSFDLKITKLVEDASGAVTVRDTWLADAALPFDPKPANNTARLVLNGTGAQDSGGTSDGSTGTAGSTGGSSGGGLAFTGSVALWSSVAAAAALAAGGVLYAVSRRRSQRV
ncbi:hypothetical protein F0344_13565 [Streptomyces finlayi]|uniref:LPXTG cell wall anchor domain-containing protein n=1 Tax=Streptomyces finlayi TaxID=67296 RepID=A0A7G7BJJ9_9ACTN|nr:hypothetical protein [Streptomyces finlayi]QNE75514.1 hypothetical protein F0344_13565 [Streptomyces finlayi]